MAAKHALTLDVREPRPERRAVVEGSRIEIGSSPSADLVVEDERVSPLHAALEIDASGEVELVDLGSEHGTFVGGDRVSRRKLRPGDRFQIGDTELTLANSDPIFAEQASYREKPRVQRDPSSVYQMSSRAERWLALALRWWPLPLATVLLVVYLASHGLALPPAPKSETALLDSLDLRWPVPRWLLLSSFVAAACALAEAVLRNREGKRTVAGRLLLVIAAVLALPLGVQLLFHAFELGTMALAIGAGLFGLGWLAFNVGRWVLRGTRE